MSQQYTESCLTPELQLTREELAQSRERLELALEVSNLSLWDWDLKNQKIHHTRTKEILGLTSEQGEEVLADLRPLVHPHDLSILNQALVSHLKGYTNEYHAEFRIKHSSGHWIWIEDRGRAVERDVQGRVLRMIGTRRDITERKQQDAVLHAAKTNSKRLKYLTEYDSLTGLANRSLFHHRLNEVVNQSAEDGSRFALLHIDLDRFKVLNDSLGIKVADQLLVQIGKRLTQIFAQANTIARLGGNEFAIILRQYGSYSSLMRLAQLTLERISRPINLAGNDLVITASMGVSLTPEHSLDASSLVSQASVALQQAKYLGGNEVQIYNERMQASALERLMLEQDLRQAVTSGELKAYYQPKLNLAGRFIGSVEALARWEHPELGMVSPGVFIPLAEETGLIKTITEQILEQACCQALAWNQQGFRISVSVNLSVHHVRQGNILPMVERVLNYTGLPAELLELELTENHLLENADEIIREFIQLRELGVRLAIDDFGTGFSSLNYLKVFPADTIKIDQSFIREIASSHTDAEITKAVMSMAHNLGIKVVAEGVERFEQLEFLRENNCDEVQGFFIAPPLPPSQLLKLLETFDYSSITA